MKPSVAEVPAWVAPGDAVTLLWHSGRGEGAGGAAMYQVAGPALEAAPASPCFLLAPVERDEFATRLYRGEAGLAELREFLAACTLVRGQLGPMLDRLVVADETPALALIDAWRALSTPPLLDYHDDIGAFLPGARPLFVTAEAHAAAREAPERFALAWVCDECGQAEDAAAFLWTAHEAGRVRVCLLIQIDAGVWSVRLHPFQFLKEAA